MCQLDAWKDFLAEFVDACAAFVQQCARYVQDFVDDLLDDSLSETSLFLKS